MSAFPYYSATRIRSAFAAHGAAPRKRWGQSFLTDAAVSQRMAEHIAAWGIDPLVEIGPGLGALSWPLLERGRRLLLLELDPVLCHLLREAFAGRNFALRSGDARPALAAWAAGDRVQFDSSVAEAAPAAAVGNVPYYITTELLLQCMAIDRLRRGAFLVQREYAARATAASAESSLTVYLANAGRWRSVFELSPALFFPRPAVHSTFIEFERHEAGWRSDPAALQFVLRRAFAARRKKLSNSMRQASRDEQQAAALLGLAEEVGIQLDRRAEQIDPEFYFALARRIPEQWTAPR
ncbi:MAG: hypothetical protein K1X75_02870 [Leptospirales bacterium]|nr:hypothetical protein [Leptospirales bacterium]